MTITWSIVRLDVQPQKDDYANVVVTAHWECLGVDGEATGRSYSSTGFPAPAEAFTPYSQLTKDEVLGWIWANGVDRAATEAAVAAQIDAIQHPTVVYPALPWATPDTVTQP